MLNSACTSTLFLNLVFALMIRTMKKPSSRTRVFLRLPDADRNRSSASWSEHCFTFPHVSIRISLDLELEQSKNRLLFTASPTRYRPCRPHAVHRAADLCWVLQAFQLSLIINLHVRRARLLIGSALRPGVFTTCVNHGRDWTVIVFQWLCCVSLHIYIFIWICTYGLWHDCIAVTLPSFLIKSQPLILIKKSKPYWLFFH